MFKILMVEFPTRKAKFIHEQTTPYKSEDIKNILSVFNHKLNEKHITNLAKDKLVFMVRGNTQTKYEILEMI